MSTILVNWSHPILTANTDNKGINCIGAPYIVHADTNEIEFGYSQITDKLNNINALLEKFRLKQYSALSAEPGESVTGTMVRQLKRELSAALFDKSIAPASVYSYYTFSDKKVSPRTISRTRAYILEILGKYKSALESILRLDVGIARLNPDGVDAPNGTIVPAGSKVYRFTVTVEKLTLPITNLVRASVNELLSQKLNEFYDESRELKTLVNFGNDTQAVALNWRYSPVDSTRLQVKLYKPLTSQVEVGAFAYISRELANTIVDGIDITYVTETDSTPSLRPRNLNVDVGGYFAQVNNATILSLGLATGSSGTIRSQSVSYADRVFQQWYTNDFNSSELNIDFSDYQHFVFYGSAAARLSAFSQKLNNIALLSTKLTAFATASSGAAASSIEIQNIIRGMDAYERFLYHTTESVVYSGSVDYADSGVEYNPTGSWPKKSDGTVYFPSESVAQNWYNTQLAIAQRFDQNNQNNLVYHLPEYIQFDENSVEFLTFVSMIGHTFDNIKVYIDQFPYIYSTHPDPHSDLTMDQLYEVANSFGLKLPNAYSLEQLNSFVATLNPNNSVRNMVSETWKRFLHSMILLYKSKGTRTSLDSVLSIYGIAPQVVQIKETSTPATDNYVQSYEYTNGIEYSSATHSYVKVPVVSSSLSAKTLEVRFIPSQKVSSSLLTSDNTWGLRLVPHPSQSKSEYGRIEFVSGTSITTIATSSYFKLYGEDYTNIVIRSQSTGINYNAIQADGDQILANITGASNLGSLWSATTFVYVGSSGSLKPSANFSGVVDEIKVWGEELTDAVITNHAYDPSSYVGNSYTSSYENLYVYLTFSIPTSSISGSSGVLFNETPYKSASIVSTVSTFGFIGTGSYERVSRYIRQISPLAGSETYSTRKVKIAPAPVFKQDSIESTGVKVLSAKRSIVSALDKQYSDGQNLVSLAISPSNFINQNIIRSIGDVNINALIGNPATLTSSVYPELALRQAQYNRYFGKTINPNLYIEFFRNLVAGPSEAAEEYIPANANLLAGVVIEPTLLERYRQPINRTLSIDGTGTRQLIQLTETASLSEYNLGVMHLEDVLPLTTGSTISGSVNPFDLILTRIGLSGSMYIRNSTAPAQLPPGRRGVQKFYAPLNQYFSSSVLDDNSSIPTLDMEIDAAQENSEENTGYARYIFIEEADTLTPLYDISPISDFSDVGTTTYFYKSNGIYRFPDITNPLVKREYIPKLDSNTNNSLAILYARITLLDSGSIVSAPMRSSATISAGTLAGNSTATGVLRTAGVFALYGIDGQSNLRLRLYRSEQAMTNDASRPFGILPSGSHGVQFDGLLNGVEDVFPYVMVQTDVVPNDGLLYYKIDNLSAIDKSGTVILYYFAYEPVDPTPQGYLPRHYRFSRENTTALKRRNYIGCVQTTETTTDGLPPIQTKLTQTNTVIVPPTTPQSGNPRNPSITFGGGGTLDVI